MADERTLLLHLSFETPRGAPAEPSIEVDPRWDRTQAASQLWGFNVIIDGFRGHSWQAGHGVPLRERPGELIEFVTRETTEPIPDCTQPFGPEHFPALYPKDPCRFCGVRLDAPRWGELSVWLVTVSSQAASL